MTLMFAPEPEPPLPFFETLRDLAAATSIIEQILGSLIFEVGEGRSRVLEADCETIALNIIGALEASGLRLTCT